MYTAGNQTTGVSPFALAQQQGHTMTLDDWQSRLDELAKLGAKDSWLGDAARLGVGASGMKAGIADAAASGALSGAAAAL